MPVDVNGMITLSDIVKDNVLSIAAEEQKRSWHSAASDLWLDKDEPQERLYHLICAGRTKDVCRLIAGEKERLLYDINDDLYDILSMIADIPERYVTDVLPVVITAAIESGNFEASGSMINALKRTDEELGLLYSADLEMKKGEHSNALSIIRSIGRTNRPEVDLRLAAALGCLGNRKEAMSLLDSMRTDIIRSGTVDGLDRVYIQMAGVAVAAGDHDSSISYLTKALGVAGNGGKKKIYSLLASSYNAIGMTDKSKECSSKAR
jgi:hypothetical protein